MNPSSTSFRRVATGRRLAGALVAASLVGCAGAPLSYLHDDQVYHKAVINRYPVRVVAIDGEYQTFRPVPITPGDHVLTVDAAPVAGFSEPVRKQVPLTVAACTRYYVAAQRRSPVLQDWAFVVEEAQPSGGCDPTRASGKSRPASSTIESTGGS